MTPGIRPGRGDPAKLDGPWRVCTKLRWRSWEPPTGGTPMQGDQSGQTRTETRSRRGSNGQEDLSCIWPLCHESHTVHERYRSAKISHIKTQDFIKGEEAQSKAEKMGNGWTPDCRANGSVCRSHSAGARKVKCSIVIYFTGYCPYMY
jgi:hypothetical protein